MSFLSGEVIDNNLTPASIILAPGAYKVYTNRKLSVSNENLPKDIGKQIVLFPNPARDRLYIDSPLSFIRADIIDLQGRLIRSESKINNSIDIQDIQKGMAILRFLDYSGSAMYKRVIIQ
jgi:hypothetical protein